MDRRGAFTTFDVPPALYINQAQTSLNPLEECSGSNEPRLTTAAKRVKPSRVGFHAHSILLVQTNGSSITQKIQSKRAKPTL